MNGEKCLGDKAHVPSLIKEYHIDDYQTSVCSACSHPLKRYYIEADDDRAGRWSRWAADRLIIEELP